MGSVGLSGCELFGAGDLCNGWAHTTRSAGIGVPMYGSGGESGLREGVTGRRIVELESAAGCEGKVGTVVDPKTGIGGGGDMGGGGGGVVRGETSSDDTLAEVLECVGQESDKPDRRRGRYHCILRAIVVCALSARTGEVGVRMAPCAACGSATFGGMAVADFPSDEGIPSDKLSSACSGCTLSLVPATSGFVISCFIRSIDFEGTESGRTTGFFGS